ncbi:hypothetical protein [Acinetobacter sp.]|uniref:hypothetical protein n=1 Tax=Acinetobacter sp. TaxID=472 RepID=UPI0028AA2723|nr:hypothetical protein [Acinetobacter sp.]
MKKVLFALALCGFTSSVIAQSLLKQDIQVKILQEQITALDRCSALAFINPNILLNSAEFQKYCTIPYEIFSDDRVFDESVIDEDSHLIFKTASAVAHGIIVRNKNDRGLFVEPGDREKFYSSPYDGVTTSQMPKVLCACLESIYKKTPKYFNKKPTCIDLITNTQN